MLELREWIATADFPDKPWMILGKGPTFADRGRFPLSEYNLLGLNHVVLEEPVDVAHAIDVDVVDACGERLLENCKWLLMPRRPHVDFDPGPELLEDYLARSETLRRLDAEGRLVWYNAASALPIGDSPVIGVKFFSAEAALNILGEMGVSTVRSLGVDGGRGYSAQFKHLHTRLANKRGSFDSQTEELAAISRARGIDYQPLVQPCRVYVGLDESQLVAFRVLKYTIEEHATRPVRVEPMLELPVPMPKDRKNRPRTGFSFSRFLIPALAGYQGRAMYLDADMQVFGDITGLWDLDMGERTVLCTRQDEAPALWKDSSWFKPGRQMSVMMLDCGRLDWNIETIVAGLDDGAYSYEDLLFDMCIVPPEQLGDDLPPVWNHLEHYEPGETKLIHYTVVPTQPWKNDQNPLRRLWEADYRRAVEAGAIDPVELRRLVRQGHVKPSLAQGVAGASAGAIAFDTKIAPAIRRMYRKVEAKVPVLRSSTLQRIKYRVPTTTEAIAKARKRR